MQDDREAASILLSICPGPGPSAPPAAPPPDAAQPVVSPPVASAGVPRVPVESPRVAGLAIVVREPEELSDLPEASPPSPNKRMVWSEAMHARFEEAVYALGTEHAKPQAILRLMGHAAAKVTTCNIKSHLQKYRIRMAKHARLGLAAGLAAAAPHPSTPQPGLPPPAGAAAAGGCMGGGAGVYPEQLDEQYRLPSQGLLMQMHLRHNNIVRAQHAQAQAQAQHEFAAQMQMQMQMLQTQAQAQQQMIMSYAPAMHQGLRQGLRQPQMMHHAQVQPQLQHSPGAALPPPPLGYPAPFAPFPAHAHAAGMPPQPPLPPPPQQPPQPPQEPQQQPAAVASPPPPVQPPPPPVQPPPPPVQPPPPLHPAAATRPEPPKPPGDNSSLDTPDIFGRNDASEPLSRHSSSQSLSSPSLNSGLDSNLDSDLDSDLQHSGCAASRGSVSPARSTDSSNEGGAAGGTLNGSASSSDLSSGHGSLFGSSLGDSATSATTVAHGATGVARTAGQAYQVLPVDTNSATGHTGQASGQLKSFASSLPAPARADLPVDLSAHIKLSLELTSMMQSSVKLARQIRKLDSLLALPEEQLRQIDSSPAGLEALWAAVRAEDGGG